MIFVSLTNLEELYTHFFIIFAVWRFDSYDKVENM